MRGLSLENGGVVMSRVQARAEEMMARHGFLGVPLENFASGGRSHLMTLLGQGLNPESKVLDFGCGVLPVAYWLRRFIASCHHQRREPAPPPRESAVRHSFT